MSEQCPKCGKNFKSLAMHLKRGCAVHKKEQAKKFARRCERNDQERKRKALLYEPETQSFDFGAHDDYLQGTKSHNAPAKEVDDQLRAGAASIRACNFFSDSVGLLFLIFLPFC